MFLAGDQSELLLQSRMLSPVLDIATPLLVVAALNTAHQEGFVTSIQSADPPHLKFTATSPSASKVIPILKLPSENQPFLSASLNGYLYCLYWFLDGFGQFWFLLVGFSWFWLVFVCLCLFLFVFVGFVGFGLIWLVLVAFDWFWFGIVLFDLVWSGLV